MRRQFSWKSHPIGHMTLESNVIAFRSKRISYPILSIALERMLPISYQEYPRRLEMMTRNSLTGTIGTGVTFALA